MHTINPVGLDDQIVSGIAHRSSVADKNFVLFLDNMINTVRADAARKNLLDHPNWQYLRPRREKEATGKADIHACTVRRQIIANQQLPPDVIEAINGYDLLVYLDATHTKEQGLGVVLTLAHELRHVWQYFNAPVVLHSQTALSWVHPLQETPCELDAERAAKRMAHDMYGETALRTYLDAQLASCKPEHRDVLQRLAALDPAADTHMEKETVALLEQHGAEIRQYQADHNFMIPGIPELIEALRGKSDVRLRP